jgi:hypothetical protein
MSSTNAPGPCLVICTSWGPREMVLTCGWHKSHRQAEVILDAIVKTDFPLSQPEFRSGRTSFARWRTCPRSHLHSRPSKGNQKLQSARLLFSELQLAAIILPSEETNVAFLKVSLPLVSLAMTDSQCPDDVQDVLDGGRPSLTSPRGCQ